MFTLSEYYQYDSTLEEIVLKAISISDSDHDLMEKAVRHGVANYDTLKVRGVGHIISETCRGCDLLVRAEKATVRNSQLLYKIWRPCVRCYSIINNIFPLVGIFLASWAFLPGFLDFWWIIMTGNINKNKI